MARGGARPGAGRKPRALRYARQVAHAESALVAAVPAAVSCLAKAAERGDVTAARYILDRVLGRPKEQEAPLADDMRAATDNPRLHDGWRVEERERAVAAWFELRRREGELSINERTVAIAVEIAGRLAFEQSVIRDAAEGERLLAERDARDRAMREIVRTRAREEWDAALAAWDSERFALQNPSAKARSALPSKVECADAAAAAPG